LQQPLDITYIPGKRLQRRSNAEQPSADSGTPNPSSN